jgi:CRISPR/Cas system-associated exonuclease Cas4 (RecB family)
MKTVRASEIGTFLYCRRAWWYQRHGTPSENQAELLDGSALHERHGRAVMASGCLQVAAYGLLIVALALFVAYAMGLVLP